MKEHEHKREMRFPTWALCAAISLLLGVISPAAWGQDDECHPEEIPNLDQWLLSGHADGEAEAFTHWDEDDPPEVSSRCAKCHSTPGFQDFLGVDGTEAGTVDNAAPIGTTVECIACHNDGTAVLDSVVMPSGIEVAGLGDEAVCMQCHQGRASKFTVDNAIADANVPDDDTVMEGARFVNIHYYAAAATKLGTVAKGGYQYDGKSYDAEFAHVQGIDTCIDCHDAHTLAIKVESCASCHPGVLTVEDLKDVRMVSSSRDYDGDGDVAEGIYHELDGLRNILYAAMQAYAGDAGAPIVYESHTYPYFFADTNGNGQADPDEASYANGYSAWTPRLLKAAYNYQTSLKDPGAFAHGGKYMIQLLYDSIEDLDAGLTAGLVRIDAGHFAGSEEAWRHWDEDGHVPGSCSKCHSATGLPFLLDEGVTVSQPLSNGMLCTTCHSSMEDFARHVVEEVEFPSGAVLSTGDLNSNVCTSCHQGRESGASVDGAIAGLDLDTVSDELRFINIHYFAAGANLFGAEAGGAYQYEGKVYRGRLGHVGGFDTCTECHDAHTLKVNEGACANPFCHGGAAPQNIRKDPRDFDGDGSTTEGLAAEIASLREILYGAMLDYAADVANAPILYANNYPYFFNDSNGNGQVDAGENSYGNRYSSWTPRLLRTAYNYQYAKKDPGGFAHNGQYVIQVLYDSLEDLGSAVPVDMSGMVRP